MESIGLIIMVALALYRLFTSPFFKDSITGSRNSDYKQHLRDKNQPSTQETLKRKTGISNVSGYKPGVWIGHKHERGLKTYFMLASNAVVLAQTTINGSIYPGRYPAIHRLILAVYSYTEDDEGYQTLLYGSVDDDFNIVIPPLYHELKFEKNYYAIVKTDDLYGVYSSENKLVVPVDYENIIHDDLNRRFLAQIRGICHLFDYKGNIIKELNCTYVCPAQKGKKLFVKTFMAEVSEKNSPEKDHQLVHGKWGLFDANYNELIPPKYELLYNSPDYALIMSGKLLVQPVEPWPGMLEYYFATGGKWGISDFNDQVLVPVEYDWVDFTHNTELFLVNRGGTMFYLKTSNRNGFWGVQNGKWGLVNISNEVIVPIEFDHVSQTKDEVRFQKGSHTDFADNLPYQSVSLQN